MRKRALRKDFYVEIRKSLGRFLSIFFIVAMGVAFLSGIRASEPDMRYSGDVYFDRHRLMDIQVMGSLGLTEQDVKALEDVEGVERVEPGYSADVLAQAGENLDILHVSSILEEMNQYTVEEGRMPEKSGECFMDQDFFESHGFKIGDQITLISGTDDALSDTFSRETFEIVGSGSSPCYISFGRGSSAIGNGTVNGFLAVLPQDFALEVYTECNVTVEGAKELVAFTDEYERQVEDTIDRIEKIAPEQGKLRADAIRGEANEELEKAKKELEDAKKEADEKLFDALSKIEDGEREISDGKAKLESAKQEMEDRKRQLNESQEEIESAYEQIARGEEELEQGWAEFEQQEAEFNRQYEAILSQRQEAGLLQGHGTEVLQQQEAGLAQLEEGRAALEEARSRLEASENELLLAKAQADEGRRQIEDGFRAIREGEAEIAKGEAEISENEQKLTDARKEYQDGKEEAEQKIKEGEAKINEAQQKIDEIEDAVWYVNDRNALPEYTGYGDNANRMRAIGEAFPILFFIVAALISLTAMTRMVEEQRMHIGTLKALGYGKFSIAGQYLSYALLASIGGSVFGVAFGEKVFPYVIVTSYKILYFHMQDVVMPYEWHYAVMATVAAVFCTGFATLLACYKELASQPAVLMRPPAPKQGKRVFLERVGFIWKRLGFTWKSTIRNLIRYKKRFFMTIFGIGGCMALMIVGFGLRDSIFAVGNIQYKQLQVYDGMVILDSDADDKELEELDALLQAEKEITSLSKSYMKKINIQKEKMEEEVYLFVPANLEKNGEFFCYRDRASHEEYELKEDSVILTEKMAQLLKLKEGDAISLKNDKGEEKELTITNICENYMNHYLYISPTVYEELFGEPFEENAIFFQMKDANQEKLQQIGEKILEMPAALNISYTYDIEEQMDNILESLDIVIVVLIISAGLLAFVVLYNLNTINITERKRELATLKVLGFYDGEVSAYVYRENILLTIIGAMVGSFMGMALHHYVIATVEIDKFMFTRIIEPISFIYSMLLTFAFSIFVNVAMHFKLKKINMVESLKSVE